MRLGHLSSILMIAVLGLIAVVATGAGAPAWAADCGATPCSCGDTVTADRTLVCGSDPVTTTVCPGDGLTVSDGVTLDLGGCTITGDSKDHTDVGIVVAGQHITVTNGRVTNFGFGVATLPGSPTSDSTLSVLQIFANGEGIRLAAEGSTLTRLQVRQNDRTGIDLVAADTVITKSVLRLNGGAGIILQAGPWAVNANTVSLNRCESNGAPGLQIHGVVNTIARNILLRNGGDGAEVDGSGHIIDRNQGKFNGHSGFHIQGEDHTVTLNIAQSNDIDGFTVSASESALSRNTGNYNGGYGIHDASPASDNTYSANKCTGNALGKSRPPGLCK